MRFFPPKWRKTKENFTSELDDATTATDSFYSTRANDDPSFLGKTLLTLSSLSSSSSSSPSLCLSIFAFCVQKRKVDSRKFSADDGWGNEKRRERETKSIPLPIQEERAPANNNNTKRERMNAID